MAVRVPNLGLGDGKTGDTELKIRQDYNHNFEDQSNAASRLVGPAAGQVPLAQHIVQIAGTHIDRIYAEGHGGGGDANNFEQGTVYFCMTGYCINHPFPYSLIKTIRSYLAGTSIQIAQNYLSGEIRVRYANGGNTSWSEWRPTCDSDLAYTRTTAAGANVVVDENGKLMRSTSSERYKDILAPLELDDARYADAMALKPIVYRSTADADNPLHHFYSFSAEELGAYDPAFTLWRYTEQVTDADGITTEQPLAERQAEGININALLAMSHAIAIKQDKLIKALEARIEILEAK